MVTVKRCPQCRSFNVGLRIGGLSGEWECTDCTYHGALILEEDLGGKEKSTKKVNGWLSRDIKRINKVR